MYRNNKLVHRRFSENYTSWFNVSCCPLLANRIHYTLGLNVKSDFITHLTQSELYSTQLSNQTMQKLLKQQLSPALRPLGFVQPSGGDRCGSHAWNR